MKKKVKYKETMRRDVNAFFTLKVKRMDEKQMALIRAAYEFAIKAHERQYRNMPLTAQCKS